MPVDPGVFYIARVAATLLHVLIMGICVAGLYTVFFNASPWERPVALILVLASFSLATVALGVVVSAMTSALRRPGEVLLRILVVPLMIPVIWWTLRANPSVFGEPLAGGALGPPVELDDYLLLVSAMNAVYVTAGYLLFPKAIEE